MTGTQVQAPVAPQGAPVDARHERPVQQPLACVQAWPTETHADGWHVPVMVPGGIAHDVPVQQSAVAVHTPPCGWQTRAGPHIPFVQSSEQHCADDVHVARFARHWPASLGPASTPPSKSRHAPPEHASGAQQPPEPPSSVQLPPGGTHVGTTHCTPPSAPGTHAAPLQHWSRNWQRLPASMQHGAWPV